MDTPLPPSNQAEPDLNPLTLALDDLSAIGDGVPPHADLECPECGSLCKPKRETADGGASYRCRRANNHADFREKSFRIDGNGDLHE
jgi:hypothetical protein